MKSCREPVNYVKSLTLLGIISLYTLTVSAQYIFTAEKPVGTIRATIYKYEGIQLRDSIPYTKLLIIDSRYDTTSIGYYISKYLDLNDASHLAGLQHVMDKYYQPLCLEGKDTLLIQLENLSIEDKIISQDSFIYTAGYVTARLYRGRNDSYMYFGNIDTFMQEPYSSRLTHKSPRNGKHNNKEFWDYYLLRLYEAILRKASAYPDTVTHETNQPLTIEEIKKLGLAKRDKPILTTDSLHPGFYRNFSEFVNNNPTFLFQNNEALKNLLRVMHYNVDKNTGNEEPDTTYWGYCDGNKIYVRYYYDFYQLERKDCAFYIAPTLDARRREINTAGSNIFLALLGAAVSVATNTSIDLSGVNVPAPYIPMVIFMSGYYRIAGLQLDWDNRGITF